MKFCVSTLKEEKALQKANEITSILLKSGYILDEQKPEVVISLGGDGTFLRSIQKYFNIDPLFVNLNFGNLGYLCEYSAAEIDDLITDLLDKTHTIREVSLLEANFNGRTEYAINEFRIEADRGSTITFDVKINNTFLEKIKGDGCLISSSIGSSGMSRSLGGALVDNEIEMIQFVEKAPINNKFYASIHSPYVLNKDKVIKIENIRPIGYWLFYDCKSIYMDEINGPICFSISDKKIRFLKNTRNNYIKKTREAFLHD